MKKSRRIFIKSISVAASFVVLSFDLAWAKTVKSIRILVGFPAGGGTDRVARILAEQIFQISKTNVYVENKSGAGGLLAAQALLQGQQNTDSIFLSHDHTISILPLFPQNGNSAFTFINSLQPIAGVATFANAFAVSASIPVKSFAEYLTWLKTQSINRYAVGIPAPNSIPEYLVGILKKHFQVDLNAIAYRGSAPMLNELLGNQISACVASVPELIEYQKTGHLRILAVLGGARQPIIPEVPTFKELGLSGFDALPYYGFFAAPGTSTTLVENLEYTINQAIANQSVQDRLSALGLNVHFLNSTQFEKQVQDYSRVWKSVIQG